MRQNGARGACYEVSQLIFKQFGFHTAEGVYQHSDGRPIYLHRWNIMPDGSILDGTADQFGEGHDVFTIDPSNAFFQRYRPIWTNAFNPSTIDTYKNMPWTNFSDQDYWNKNQDPQGWWLEDLSIYIEWKRQMVEQYPSFRRKDDIDFLALHS